MADKPDPRIRLIEEVGRWKVYLVDGPKARQRYKDFTQGANFMAYAKGSRFAERGTGKFEEDEIWVEQMLNPEEEPFILLHELHETNDMIEFHFGYEHAHELANEYEFKARDNPDRLQGLLEKERKRALMIQSEMAQDEGDTHKPVISKLPNGRFLVLNQYGHPAGRFNTEEQAQAMVDALVEGGDESDLTLIEVVTPGDGAKEEDVAPNGISTTVHVYPGD